MKTLTDVRKSLAVCSTLSLERKRGRNLKKKKSEEQGRASQILKWH